MADVVAIGELLYDVFVLPEREVRVEFGGSPANLCVHLARAGHSVILCARAGYDGAPLVRILRTFGVDTRWISMDSALATTKVILRREPGAPEFELERGADVFIGREDIVGLDLGDAKLVHTTAFALSRSPMREAALALLERAESLSIALSLDVNYRPSMWDDPWRGRSLIASLIPRLRWIKLSAHDAEHFLGTSDPGNAIRRLKELGARGICLSLGPKGALILEGKKRLELAAPKVEVVDPKGAGDALYAGILHGFLTEAPLEEAATIGLEWAGSVLQGRGSIPEGKGVIAEREIPTGIPTGGKEEI